MKSRPVARLIKRILVVIGVLPALFMIVFWRTLFQEGIIFFNIPVIIQVQCSGDHVARLPSRMSLKYIVLNHPDPMGDQAFARYMAARG